MLRGPSGHGVSPQLTLAASMSGVQRTECGELSPSRPHRSSPPPGAAEGPSRRLQKAKEGIGVSQKCQVAPFPDQALLPGPSQPHWGQPVAQPLPAEQTKASNDNLPEVFVLGCRIHSLTKQRRKEVMTLAPETQTCVPWLLWGKLSALRPRQGTRLRA